MGFEVVFHYHEMSEEGGYNKEGAKEMKKKVGAAYEDVSLDKLVSVILPQLARRDIFIFDTEVYEYQKQKLKFKQIKNGIVVKNKKFVFDNELNLKVEEEPEEVLAPKPPPNKPVASNGRKRQIKKYITLDTDDFAIAKFKSTGLKFSIGKDYPVYAEREGAMLGSVYYFTQDDTGKEVEVSGDYFVSSSIRYTRDDGQDGFDQKQKVSSSSTPKLMYQDETDDDVPDLRIRRR